MVISNSFRIQRCGQFSFSVIIAITVVICVYIMNECKTWPNQNSNNRSKQEPCDGSRLLYTEDTYIPYRTDMQSKCPKPNYTTLDLFAEKSPKLMSHYKNPCWRENGKLLCIPYVFLVGVEKCGTTDLFMRLTKHPDFVSPYKKEIGWLARRQMFTEPNVTQLKYYASKYFSNLPKELERTGNRKLITGEGSVNTFVGSKTWHYIKGNEGQDEPRVNIPEYIHHVNKHARILINVRNPVDRLWSEYLAFSKRRNQSPYRFHNLVTTLIRLYNDCLRTRSTRACFYDYSLANFATMSSDEQFLYKYNCDTKRAIDYVRLRRGVFHVFIQDFLKVFPKEQILIQRLEDSSRDLRGTVLRTYKFLGLDISDKQLDDILKAGIKNTRKPKHRKVEGMFKSTRQMLYKFYKPHNEALARLLNDTAFNYGPIGG